MVSGVVFEGNIARDGANTNQGGAISLKESSSLRVGANTKFTNNSVIGKNTNGGAVWISSATEARISGATFEGNMVRVLGEYGYGGALHCEGSKVLLDSCGFDSNIALADATANGANAGGISVWQDAELTVLDTSFSANQAGGRYFAEEMRAIHAAHILSAGNTVVRTCIFMSTAPISPPFSAPWWIVGTGGSRIALVNSTFRGATAGQPEGMLSMADDATALLRSCAGSNVLIDPKVAGGKLGIVDSTFEPALSTSLKSIAPPECGVEVAGQRLCDPRAACTLRSSGGVRCKCEGEGIEPPTAVHDGSRCTTTRNLLIEIVNSDVRLFLRKSESSKPLNFHIDATGDEGFNASYFRRTVLRRNNGSAVLTVVAQSDDGLHARVFGLAFEWENALQAPSVEPITLDSAKQQYSANIEHEFTLSLQCGRNATTDPATDRTTCPQDGDTIETTIDFIPHEGGAPSTSSGADLPASVRITTEVQAAVSCEHTKPHVTVVADSALDSILPDAPLSVHLLAMDMDDLPVSFSPAELVLTWDGHAVPFDWLRGRSRYSWQIPPDRDAGEHEIVVSLKGSNCTLRRLTLTVTSDKTQMIVIGCIAGATILVLVALAFLVWKNADRAKELIFSLLSYEGLLTAEVCIETWYARRGRAGLHCPHPCVTMQGHRRRRSICRRYQRSP